MTSPNREIRQHTSPHLARVISVVPLPHVGSRTGFSWILVLGSLEELESHNHLALLDFSAPPPPCPPNQLDNHSFTAQILPPPAKKPSKTYKRNIALPPLH